MSDLTFYYGTMESGKTTKLLQDAYNYKKHNLKVIIMKPLVDTKGDNTIVSRRGDSANVDILLKDNESIFTQKNYIKYKEAKFILVDEAQFLKKNQILELFYIAHKLNIPVICYGLKSNFKGELFEGSCALFALSDKKVELTVNCECGKIAMFNARCVNGKYSYEGEEVVIDGEHDNVEYIPLCSECYIDKVLHDSFKKIKYKKR